MKWVFLSAIAVGCLIAGAAHANPGVSRYLLVFDSSGDLDAADIAAAQQCKDDYFQALARGRPSLGTQEMLSAYDALNAESYLAAAAASAAIDACLRARRPGVSTGVSTVLLGNPLLK